MDWGNAFVRSKQTTETGKVSNLVLELHLEGDFKKTSKKVTWLSKPTAENPLIPVTLIEYDYLITKKKLEEDDSVEALLTPQTEFRCVPLSLSLSAQDLVDRALPTTD